jgi:hypothetical protein
LHTLEDSCSLRINEKFSRHRGEFGILNGGTLAGIGTKSATSKREDFSLKGAKEQTIYIFIKTPSLSIEMKEADQFPKDLK